VLTGFSVTAADRLGEQFSPTFLPRSVTHGPPNRDFLGKAWTVQGQLSLRRSSEYGFSEVIAVQVSTHGPGGAPGGMHSCQRFESTCEGHSGGSTQHVPMPPPHMAPGGKRWLHEASGTLHSSPTSQVCALWRHWSGIANRARDCRRTQSFQYVTPSQPHTGLGSGGQKTGHGAQKPLVASQPILSHTQPGEQSASALHGVGSV
jgi:hypothetical protein